VYPAIGLKNIISALPFLLSAILMKPYSDPYSGASVQQSSTGILIVPFIYAKSSK
jgi:hypothetical protein